MGDRETIPFSAKGPMAIESSDLKGCALIDLSFQYPSQIGELVFSNYYTAWLSIYIKRMSKEKEPEEASHSRDDYRSRAILRRSTSVEITYLKRQNSRDSREKSLEPLPGSFQGRRRSSPPPPIQDGQESSWELSIESKCLMPYPDYEQGSQDPVSIIASESLVEWKDIIILRLVLYQTSTLWKRFSVEDINVFKQMPNRKKVVQHQVNCQREDYFTQLKNNTIKALASGSIVEPSEVESDED